MNELNDADREAIARLICEGFMSGRVDDGEGKHISFELNVNIWED